MLRTPRYAVDFAAGAGGGGRSVRGYTGRLPLRGVCQLQEVQQTNCVRRRKTQTSV